MSWSPHILLVEDDQDIRALVSRLLQANGLRVSGVDDGRHIDRMLRANEIDLVLLDLMLSGEDGLEICRRIRTTSTLPIIMLTAKTEELDRIVGLEIGADDYVTKPFSARELLARIRAVLRRTTAVAQDRRSARVLVFSRWRLDLSRRQLRDDVGVRVSLTGAEFDLLTVFCQHARRVLSRDQLIDLTKGHTAGPFERSIDVLVSRLRHKMEKNCREPDLIQTVRSAGYMFTPDVVPEM